jgi:hypothetical protein
VTLKWLGDSSFNTKGQSEKLVARYVHTTNKVLYPISVDLTTGIFTTSNAIEGSYTAGQIISMVVNYNGTVPTKLFSEWNGVNQYGLEYITSTTFYVVNQTSSNARVTYAGGQTVDPNQLLFEYNMAAVTVDLSSVTFGNSFRTVWKGVRHRPSYSMVNVRATYGSSNTAVGLGMSVLDGRHFMLGYIEVIYHYNPDTGMLTWMEGRSANRQWNGGTSWAYAANAGSARSLEFYPNLKITDAQFQGLMANGSVIEIYTVL